MRPTTPDVHNTLPRYIQAFFLAEMFHRCCFSKNLIQLIDTDIFQGVNFLKISEGLASLNYREYHRRALIYSSAVMDNECAVTAPDSSEFHSNPIYSFPSNDQIMRVFLDNFNKRKLCLTKEMNSLSVSILSCDHTFKISKNVGSVREADNKFVTQFNQLFISLNEIGQVVAWRLTKSTAFSEFENVLVDLKERNSLTGNIVKLVCVDDCCHVRNKYESIFPGVAVKLDLFHGCQRIIRTFSRQNALCRDVTKDFIQIFRENDDQGQIRLKHAPSKEHIEKNLNSFVDRWTNIPNSPLTSETMTEISNLRKHIVKGCLSGIPPGCGTERNEQLHRLLNRSLISGATRISVELAVALLTILFHYHNTKLTAEKHKCSSKVTPVAPNEANPTDSPPSCKDNLPFKGTEKSKTGEVQSSTSVESCGANYFNGNQVIIVAENIRDLCHEFIAAKIITTMYNLWEMVENVNKKSCNRSFSAVDLIHLNKMTNILTVEENSEEDDPTIRSHAETLDRHLAGFNLQIDAVQPDGDCAFRSIVRQLRKVAMTEPKLSAHSTSLGLLIDEETDAFTLRQLFVEQLQNDSFGASNFVSGSVEEISRKANEFRIKGVFDRDIGDVVIKVCSNILKVPILVITSSQTVPVVPFTPDESITNQPMYIAFHYYGAGHYDATDRKITDSLQNVLERDSDESGLCYCGRKTKSRSQQFCKKVDGSRCPCVKKGKLCQTKCRCLNCENFEQVEKAKNDAVSCRCGENKKDKLQGTSIFSCTDVAGQRRTKCPCYATRKPCSDLCSCSGCGNDYGRRSTQTAGTPTKKRRKITSSPPSLKRTRTSTFMKDNGFEMASGQWTTEETCLVETVESFLCSSCIPPSYKNIAILYNYVLKSTCAANLKLTAEAKTERQIMGKLDYLHKREDALKNLFYGIAILDD